MNNYRKEILDAFNLDGNKLVFKPDFVIPPYAKIEDYVWYTLVKTIPDIEEFFPAYLELAVDFAPDEYGEQYRQISIPKMLFEKIVASKWYNELIERELNSVKVHSNCSEKDILYLKELEEKIKENPQWTISNIYNIDLKIVTIYDSEGLESLLYDNMALLSSLDGSPRETMFALIKIENE